MEEINYELINSNNNWLNYDVINANFNYLINVDDDFDKEITKVVKRNFNNYGKLLIGSFQLEYFKFINDFLKNSNLMDNELNWIKENPNVFFDNLNKTLNITDKNDLNELSFILNLSKILLEEFVEDNNIDCFYESIYQIQYRLEKNNFLRNFVNEFEVKNNDTIYTFELKDVKKDFGKLPDYNMNEAFYNGK